MSKDKGAPALADQFRDATKMIYAAIDANAEISMAEARSRLRRIEKFINRSLGQRVRWAMVRGGR